SFGQPQKAEGFPLRKQSWGVPVAARELIQHGRKDTFRVLLQGSGPLQSTQPRRLAQTKGLAVTVRNGTAADRAHLFAPSASSTQMLEGPPGKPPGPRIASRAASNTINPQHTRPVRPHHTNARKSSRSNSG